MPVRSDLRCNPVFVELHMSRASVHMHVDVASAIRAQICGAPAQPAVWSRRATRRNRRRRCPATSCTSMPHAQPDRTAPARRPSQTCMPAGRALPACQPASCQLPRRLVEKRLAACRLFQDRDVRRPCTDETSRSSCTPPSSPAGNLAFRFCRFPPSRPPPPRAHVLDRPRRNGDTAQSNDIRRALRAHQPESASYSCVPHDLLWIRETHAGCPANILQELDGIQCMMCSMYRQLQAPRPPPVSTSHGCEAAAGVSGVRT